MDDFNEIKMDMPEPETPKQRTLGMFGMLFTRMTSDMKFVGIFTIIYGALTCLSIIGALIGVPLIYAGMRIREAADDYTRFQATNDNIALKSAFEKQAKYFNILKILIIVALVFTVLYIILVIVMFGSFFSAMSGYNDFS
jgi:hypothetical protein